MATDDDGRSEQPSADRRAQTTMLTQLVERISDMVIVLDDTGTVRWVNGQTERFLGGPKADWLGRSVLELIHPDDRGAAAGRLAAADEASAAAGIVPPPQRLRARRADGTYREVECVATNLLDEPAVRGIVVVARDLSERETLERRVHELERAFTTAFRYSPVGRALVDLDGRWLEVNDAFTTMLGRSAQELVGTSGIEAVHPDDRGRVRAELGRLVDGTTDRVTVDVRFPRPDGNTVWTRFTVWHVLDPDGAPLYFAADVTDVTEVRAAQARFEALVEHASDLITVNDLDGTLTYASPSAQTVLGYDPAELVGHQARDLVHPDDVARVEEQAAGQFERGVAEPIQYRARHRDGTWHDLESIVTDLTREPSILGTVTNARDVTERLVAERRVTDLVEILEATSELVVVSDGGGMIVYVNRSARALLGAYEGQHVTELSSDATLERLRTDVMPTARQRGNWTGELELVDASGGVIPVATTVQVLHDEQGNVSRIATVAHDITDLKAAQRRLEFEATHDSLTGLPNRALFREIGERAIARAGRTDEELAVLFLDLDGFKLVNDSYGHDVGDVLLGTVARRLRDTVRAGDTLARLGGDEFVILCEHPRGEVAMLELSHRIIDAVSQPATIEGYEVQVGLSIGIAFSRGADKGVVDLIRDADVALYRAKHQGRGRAEVYEDAAAGAG